MIGLKNRKEPWNICHGKIGGILVRTWSRPLPAAARYTIFPFFMPGRYSACDGNSDGSVRISYPAACETLVLRLCGNTRLHGVVFLAQIILDSRPFFGRLFPPRAAA